MVERWRIQVGAKVRVGCATRVSEHGVWRTIVVVRPRAGSLNGMTIDVTPGTGRKFGRPTALTKDIDIGWILEVA